MTFRINKTRLLAPLAIFVAAFVSGCSALNSQTLDLHPDITVERQLSAEKRFEIIPKDLRPAKVIGYRQTSKEPKPAIILKDSLLLLTHTTEHALEDMGIRRFYSGEFRLEVSLVDLSYEVEQKALKQTVDLGMKMRLKISKGNKTYTGNYASTQQHVYLKTPTEAENEKIIGAIVSETMNRALNDPQFLDFIQFN